MSHENAAQPDDFFISVDEMVTLSGMSRPTIYRWIASRLIPALHLGPNGRTKRVPRDTFMAILEESRKSGAGLEKTLREPVGWAGHAPAPIVRRVPRASLEAPAADDHTSRLAKLERRYRIGSASLAEKVAHGERPPNVPPRVAQEWAGTFMRFVAR